MKQFLTLAALGSLVAATLMGCQKQAEPDFMTQQDITPLQPADMIATDYSVASATEYTPASASAYTTATEYTPAASSDFSTFVDAVPAATSVAMGSRTHTVQRGDTLWSIARRTYGDGQRWREIAQANPGLQPRKLHIGRQIMLP